MNPDEANRKIAETQLRQKDEDTKGMAAATSALPGPMRDVFALAPDITVGPYLVRRFVDRDFIFLTQLGHPVNRFSALADGSYKFEPTGELAWQLCWLMTQKIQDIKEKFKHGVDAVKEAAADDFGDRPIFAIDMVMRAIAKQMNIYGSAHLEYEPSVEGEQSPPPSCQP